MKRAKGSDKEKGVHNIICVHIERRFVTSRHSSPDTVAHTALSLHDLRSLTPATKKNFRVRQGLAETILRLENLVPREFPGFSDVELESFWRPRLRGVADA